MTDRLHFTDSDEANALLVDDPMALLIGFALDQQVTVQKAFSGPLVLLERAGTLDAVELSAMDLDGCARDAGVEAHHLSPCAYADRDAYDRAIANLLQARGVSLVCLAGFMRLVGRPLLDAFPQRILNIHPSLLPAFPGLDAQRQALDHGVRVTGATVHLVNATLDGGPIVLQAAVPVLENDTVETLAARVLVEEHRLYPAAIQRGLDGGWAIVGRRFVSTVAS